MRVLLALATALALCAGALAKDLSTMTGVGTTSCGEFANSYKTNPKIAEAIYVSWAQGFMAGMNAGLARDKKPLRGIPETKNLAAAIRQVCDQRPLASVYDVVLRLFMSLPEQQQNGL